MINRYMLIAIFIFSSLLNAKSTDLALPAEGFSWKQVDEIKAAFLLPNNWHYLKEKKGNTLAVFLTKEKIKEGEFFDTGVTVNIFRGNPSAPKQLKQIIEGLAKKFGSNVSKKLYKPFVRFNTQYDSVRKLDGIKMRTVDIALINVYTKTSYLIIFESPVSLWEKNWAIGETVLNNLALESKI